MKYGVFRVELHRERLKQTTVWNSCSIILEFEMLRIPPPPPLFIWRVYATFHCRKGERWRQVMSDDWRFPARLFILEQKLPFAIPRALAENPLRGAPVNSSMIFPPWEFSARPLLIIISIAYIGRRLREGGSGGEERERGKSKENTRAWQKREMERERGEGFKDTARARAAKNFFSPRKTFRSFPLIEKSADCFSAMRVSARAEISPWTMREE